VFGLFLFRGPVLCLGFLLFDLFRARFIALPPVKDLKQVWSALQAENLRFESINSTYERAVLRQLRTLMVSINVAPFKLVEKLCAFTAAFSVTRKAEDFNSKTCLACNIAPFYLVEKAWVCFALQPVFRVLGQREIRRVAALWVEILKLSSMNSVGKRIWSLRRRDYLATK
jgi:hypothetical protein